MKIINKRIFFIFPPYKGDSPLFPSFSFFKKNYNISQSWRRKKEEKGRRKHFRMIGNFLFYLAKETNEACAFFGIGSNLDG
jgi:hypothetical protein